MTSLHSRPIEDPDESQTGQGWSINTVDTGHGRVVRRTMQPGWVWSRDVGSTLGTERCHTRHIGVVVTGRLHVVHGDGTEAEVGPGDVYRVDPDHDGWVVGDEPLVTYEFTSGD